MKYWVKLILDEFNRSRPPLQCHCPLRENRVAKQAPAPPADDPSTYTVPAQFTELWEKLAAFAIDTAGVDDPFSRRLARQKGWTHSYALRVAQEYKKFIFLCATSGHTCTPSYQVNEAWRLHLLYTRSYWEKMCGQVLGKPIHHQMSEGEQPGKALFDELYERTLESYAATFGQPPEDIWCKRRS